MSIRRCAFLLLFVGSLVACDHQTAPTSSGADVVAAPVSHCPSQTFEGFFSAFAGDPEVQKQFTRLPLRSDSIDAGAEPEPKPVTKMLSAQDLKFPLVPSKRQVEEQGWETSVKSSENSMVVELMKPDTDYMVSYYFEREGGCWRLYRKNDASL